MIFTYYSKNYEFGIIFLRKIYFDLFLSRIWDCTPSSRPSNKALIMSSLIFLVLQGGGGGPIFINY